MKFTSIFFKASGSILDIYFKESEKLTLTQTARTSIEMRAVYGLILCYQVGD